MKIDPKAVVTLLVVVLIGAGMAVAGSQGGALVAGLPVFAVSVGLVFLIQWLAFIPAFLMQTESFYDLTGSLTYIAIAVLAVVLSSPTGPRAMLLLTLVVIWAARLGFFLFRRVRAVGKDERFDEIKPSFLRFLNAWTIQALWVSLTLGAALGAITSSRAVGIDVFALVGLAIWLIGFGIEAVADLQKNRFRSDRSNKGRFIHTGLWSWSRHPNYFGEITLWVGISVIAFPVLQGWQLLTLVSPLFVFLLITRVSGIPLLEKKAEATWGSEQAYREYRSGTSVLVPLPPRTGAGA